MIDSPEAVTKAWAEADQWLMRPRIAYWLNHSFVHGEQWVRAEGRTLEELAWAHDREWQTRLTIDKMGPRFRNLIARLTRNDLSFEVRPGTVHASSGPTGRARRRC